MQARAREIAASSGAPRAPPPPGLVARILVGNGGEWGHVHLQARRAAVAGVARACPRSTLACDPSSTRGPSRQRQLLTEALQNQGEAAHSTHRDRIGQNPRGYDS